jgi:hypothetical protein
MSQGSFGIPNGIRAEHDSFCRRFAAPASCCHALRGITPTANCCRRFAAETHVPMRFRNAVPWD